MRDRNPAVSSRICPKCGEKSFRMGITVFFVMHWGCYCENCGYTTTPSVSAMDGCKPWMDAKEVK